MEATLDDSDVGEGSDCTRLAYCSNASASARRLHLQALSRILRFWWYRE